MVSEYVSPWMTRKSITVTITKWKALWGNPKVNKIKKHNYITSQKLNPKTD